MSVVPEPVVPIRVSRDQGSRLSKSQFAGDSKVTPVAASRSIFGIWQTVFCVASQTLVEIVRHDPKNIRPV